MISDPGHLLEIDSLKMTVEEGAEIHAELVRAISGFVGEKLTPCDPSCCPGRFGPAGEEFMRIGIEAYDELFKERP